MTGTYNAIVINSESTITGVDMKFAKRLDEVYGTITSKREVAASMNWQKLSVKQAAVARPKSFPKEYKSAQIETQQSGEIAAPNAAVKEELSLNLTAVINPKKWQQGLTASQFSGSLSTNEGVIESLSVSLPNGEGVSVSFSEMAGNVFEYDFEGELYSGMMYQDGKNSYVVTLTNGPLEGTRLTFTGEESVEDQMKAEDDQRMMAENTESEAGTQAEQVAAAEPAPAQAQTFDAPEMTPEASNYDQMLQQQAMQAQEQGENPYAQPQAFNQEQQQDPNQMAM